MQTEEGLLFVVYWYMCSGKYWFLESWFYKLLMALRTVSVAVLGENAIHSLVMLCYCVAAMARSIQPSSKQRWRRFPFCETVGGCEFSNNLGRKAGKWRMVRKYCGADGQPVSVRRSLGGD